MGLFGYLILGAFMYLAGFLTHQKMLNSCRVNGEQLPISHAVLRRCLLSCFVVMLVVSVLIGRIILHHETVDWLFVLVNSAVATTVYYFGANPDTTKMNLPD
ncbi:hypothetical protein [Moraxella oculi]|uniref:DUF3784 domain-containing protein n=1 Tax=Moraxella oculi TaxID=2940516 RepID=A0ABW8U9I3_9GAMM